MKIAIESKGFAPQPWRRRAGTETSASGHRGFTLIEMVGVLTVVMILATVIFATTIRQLDVVAGNQESATLKSYGDALQQSIRRNRQIPGATNWAITIAAESGANVATVMTNTRGRPRILLIHPQIEIGQNNGGLPYSQNVTGSVVTVGGEVVPPKNPQLMILSSVGPPLPASLTAGFSIAQWQDLWNTPDGTLPAGGSPWDTWGGSGADLKIRRIDLSPLFVHVMLNNYGTPGGGQYSIDSLATNTVPNTAVGTEAYFLKDTVLGLFKHTGTMESQQIVAHDCTYFYASGIWQASLTEPPVTPPTLEYMAIRFYTSPWNLHAAGPPETQGTVLDAMEAFMNAYGAWAAGGFPGGSAALRQAVVAAQSALNQATLNLDNNPVEGDCQLP